MGKFVDLNEVCERKELSKSRLINLIKRGEVNGCLVTDGRNVITGFVDADEVDMMAK